MTTTYAVTVRGWRIAFVIAVAVQFWALYVPRAPSVDTGDFPLDKLVHLGLFAVVAWLGLRVGIAWHVLLPALLLQAAASELVQGFFLPQRGGDWWDLCADVSGITLGFLIYRWGNRDTSPDAGNLQGTYPR
jgi:hypothetical protein